MSEEIDVVNDSPTASVDFVPASPVAGETGLCANKRPADEAAPLDLSLPKRRRQQ